MTAQKENPMDTPLKWGPFLLTIALLIGGYIYTIGQRDADNAQTKAIVAEMRTQFTTIQSDATKKNLQDEVRYTQQQEFQASTLAKLSDLVQRVTTMEHSRR